MVLFEKRFMESGKQIKISKYKKATIRDLAN